MYPMEYIWMAVETPVTNRAIVIDSGSTRIPALTCRPATGNQVNIVRSADAVGSGPAEHGHPDDERGHERAGRGGRAYPPGNGLAEAPSGNEVDYEAQQGKATMA